MARLKILSPTAAISLHAEFLLLFLATRYHISVDKSLVGGHRGSPRFTYVVSFLIVSALLTQACVQYNCSVYSIIFLFM